MEGGERDRVNSQKKSQIPQDKPKACTKQKLSQKSLSTKHHKVKVREKFNYLKYAIRNLTLKINTVRKHFAN